MIKDKKIKRYNLISFRAGMGLSQLDMAKIGKIGLTTYNFIENGKQDGKLKTWNNWQNEFNWTGEQLCEYQKLTTQGF